MSAPVDPPEAASAVSTIAGCARVLVVLPLFGLQACGLAGTVASANGFDRFVPRVLDQDGDGWREIVVGCPDDPCAMCDYHDLGPLHLATVVAGSGLCETY